MRSAGLENYFGSLKADTHIREIIDEFNIKNMNKLIE